MAFCIKRIILVWNSLLRSGEHNRLLRSNWCRPLYRAQSRLSAVTKVRATVQEPLLVAVQTSRHDGVRVQIRIVYLQNAVRNNQV
jgi:hypothetical protein